MTQRADIRLLTVAEVRCLRLESAARYAGLGKTKFLELVDRNRMPKPFRVDSCVLWDVRDLDDAIDALKNGDGLNPWDED